MAWYVLMCSNRNEALIGKLIKALLITLGLDWRGHSQGKMRTSSWCMSTYPANKNATKFDAACGIRLGGQQWGCCGKPQKWYSKSCWCKLKTGIRVWSGGRLAIDQDSIFQFDMQDVQGLAMSCVYVCFVQIALRNSPSIFHKSKNWQQLRVIAISLHPTLARG